MEIKQQPPRQKQTLLKKKERSNMKKIFFITSLIILFFVTGLFGNNYLSAQEANVIVKQEDPSYLRLGTIQLGFEDTNFHLNLTKGWSIISLPVMPLSAAVKDLFPEAVVIYGYDQGRGYVRIAAEEKLEVGKGYWILLDQNQSYILTGKPILSYSRPVYSEGWEIIGGCSVQAKASSENCAIKVIYGYEQGTGYQRLLESDNFNAGKGFWILFNEVAGQANFLMRTTASDEIFDLPGHWAGTWEAYVPGSTIISDSGELKFHIQYVRMTSSSIFVTLKITDFIVYGYPYGLSGLNLTGWINLNEEFVKINLSDDIYNYDWTLYNMEINDSSFSCNLRIESPVYGYVIGRIDTKRYIPD